MVVVVVATGLFNAEKKCIVRNLFIEACSRLHCDMLLLLLACYCGLWSGCFKLR